MKVVFISLLLSLQLSAKKFVGVFYYKNLFGHVHETADEYSSSLTTVACGHPMKVYERPEIDEQKWAHVSTAGNKGYVLRKDLLATKPSCMQAKYPGFFNSMDLGLTQMYYWGKLNDMYIEGKSRVR